VADGPDEALVAELVSVIEDSYGWGSVYFSDRPEDFEQQVARAVLAHLADRLIPADAEEREEWGWSDHDDPERRYLADEAMVMRMVTGGFMGMTGWRRTVRTWKTPDGSTGTLVGPWVEVEG
jgi:hypothetical protein